MSPQQRRLAAAGAGRLAVYKELIVGDAGWLTLAGFELYNLLIAPLGSLVGMALRSFCAPLFFSRFGRKSVLGRSVTIRQPRRIALGKGVIVDDAAVIDVRTVDGKTEGVGIEIGDHVLIGRGSIVSTRGGHVRLADAVNVSSYCRIATQTSIEIGPSVLIAAYVYIGCGNHTVDDTSTPMIEQGISHGAGVKIGAGVWIGSHATILDGVTIGENAVIGSHALVKDNVPPNAIVAGIPAKVIRMRGAAKKE